MEIHTTADASSEQRSNSLKWTLRGSQDVHYTVEFLHGMLSLENDWLAKACAHQRSGTDRKRCLVVIDAKVDEIYGAAIRAYFEHHGVECSWMALQGDEAGKTIASTLRVVNSITEFGLLRRSESVVAIGGGVVMDVVGFASSLYRRGVTYIKVPTTLMGQIDAGIGIKTGVNHDHHKNRLGTYYPSAKVLIDPGYLKTLTPRHIRNGVAEIIKMGIIKDRELFGALEAHVRNLTPDGLTMQTQLNEKIFFRAITGMLEELESNFWETELRRLVDFGHTFSPLLEMVDGAQLLHGEAVAVDMALSVAVALQLGLLSSQSAQRCLDLLLAAGLPITHPALSVELASDAVRDATKHRDGLLRMPLPVHIGEAQFVDQLENATLADSIAYLANYTSRRALKAAVPAEANCQWVV